MVLYLVQNPLICRFINQTILVLLLEYFLLVFIIQLVYVCFYLLVSFMKIILNLAQYLSQNYFLVNFDEEVANFHAFVIDKLEYSD